ncbi:hypothetical protein QBC41DRAFT_378989 [Cercophora samala]|uniref:Uncharacterized protein n=1 Tax=Cercophora samala TaxID=330535 RepID=A0AA39Z8J5_9PEZI|nr:hypothetical protein QBC41DRAFT_378989 [Cercophora samala]
MSRLALPQRLLWARARVHPQIFHQRHQRRSAVMPVCPPPHPQPRTIRPDPDRQQQPMKTGLLTLDTCSLELFERPVCITAAAASSPPSSGPPSDPNDLPPDLEEGFVSLDYALAVLRSLMTLAEKDRDDHGFSLGPLSNKGTVEMQRGSDELDCVQMTAMIVHRAKSTWDPARPNHLREMLMVEKRRKGRMGRGNSSDRLLEELLIHDIARRLAPIYKHSTWRHASLNVDRQSPDFMTVRDAIWPAYETARERQGFRDPDDLTMGEKSLADFYV